MEIDREQVKVREENMSEYTARLENGWWRQRE